jgi:quercetin dioxygenase-like cupin family protein
MNVLDQARRSLLLSLSALTVAPMITAGSSRGAAAAPGGYVLDAGQGEHLIHFRDGGDVFIMAGTTTGSDNYSMGTQQVKAGGGIPVHRHLHMEEAFYVLEGSGECILDEAHHQIARGASIFIPRNTWHGFSTPRHDLVLLWTMTPAGLDGFFRETCSSPGGPAKQLTKEQIRQIALKYGTEFST